MNGMDKFLKKWLAISRSRLFVAVTIPALVGSAVALSEDYFSCSLFILMLFGLILAESANLLFADWASYGGHIPFRERIEPPPSIEGSPMIPEKLLPLRYTLHAGVICLVAGGIIFTYFLWLRGWPIMMFALLALTIGFFYVLSPVRYGFFSTAFLPPIIALGAYYVLSASLSWKPVLAGLPLAFLSGGVIFIYRILYRGGKVEKFNSRRKYLRLLYILCYITMLATTITGYTPYWIIIVLLAVPLILKIEKSLNMEKEHYLPATSLAVLLYSCAGALIASSYLLTNFI